MEPAAGLPRLIPHHSHNIATLPNGVLTPQELGLHHHPQDQPFPVSATFIVLQLGSASLFARASRKKTWPVAKRGRRHRPTHSHLLLISARITGPRFLVHTGA